jgi:hypothetical protein
MKKKSIAFNLCFILILIGCTSSTVSRKSTPTAETASSLTHTASNTPTATILTNPNPVVFSFVSMGDSQLEAANFNPTVDQIATLHPNLVIFHGDLEINGVVNADINPIVNEIKNAGLFDQTFFVQGDHGEGINGSSALRESCVTTSPNIEFLPAGVTDYVSLDSTSAYPNYSFVYGNSMFLGLDVPGNADVLVADQLTFLDSCLTVAESKGLVHTFIFFHGPLTCIESTSCDCTTRPDANCPPSELVSVLNKHPIVSATFHGHDHILAWTHMDEISAAGLNTSFQELRTPPPGGLPNIAYPNPARMDYIYLDVGSSQGFPTISVNGSSFTVTFYKVGTSVVAWTKTFTKDAPVAADNSVANIRPLKYFLADRVRNNADFATLAAWGINTAMVDFNVNGKPEQWQAVFVEAAKYGINIVIWPSDWIDRRPDCDWAAPFPVSANGDITKVKPLLDVASQYSNFIGIINGHESLWTCTNMSFDEMAGLKDQLKAYTLSKGRAIKVWNYTDSLDYDESMLPASQIPRIMDVAVIWKNCAGNTTDRCAGDNSMLARIKNSRARLTKLGLGGKIELVFIIQTFTTDSPYNVKFTLSELQNYACEFLHTSALDGFGFYTWDAGWWPDLHSWPDLQPAILYTHDNCVHMDP